MQYRKISTVHFPSSAFNESAVSLFSNAISFSFGFSVAFCSAFS